MIKLNEAMLKQIKKNMKADDNSVITPSNLVMAYIKPETEEPTAVKSVYFEQLDLDEKQMILSTFGKVISGKINQKIYELDFKEDATNMEVGHTQDMLLDMVDTTEMEDFNANANIIINKIIDNFMYEYPVVVSILKFQYSTEEEIFNFVAASVNKIENQKGVFVLDMDGQGNGDFISKYYTEPIIKLSTPEDGFLYPSVETGSLNVNKIINFHKKKDEINPLFVDKVLDAEIVLTSKQEKNYFNSILREALGDSVKPSVLAEIYTIIAHTFDLEEELSDRVIHKNQLQRILEEKVEGFEADLDHIYEDVMAVQNYGFKVDNILPEFGKRSVRIKSDEADISIEPKTLNKIRQVKTEEGETFLMIRITNESTADGISLASEEIQTISFEE